MLRFGVSDDQLVYPEPVIGPETGYRVRQRAVSVRVVNLRIIQSFFVVLSLTW